MAPDYDFKKIYDKYHPVILRYLTRIAGPDEAEDIAQDVFEKANKSLGRFHGKSKLSTWIYRIATNTAVDRSRSAIYKHAKEHIAIEDNACRELQDVTEDRAANSTDQLVIQKEMRECINEYIDKLPAAYKTVIVLSELEGLSNKEIAEILNISLDNAKIWLHRARTKLREVLNSACEFYYTEQNTLACDRKQVQILPKIPE
jgi:RNA polymerase sigma-70 factor (ECF subfamily)